MKKDVLRKTDMIIITDGIHKGRKGYFNSKFIYTANVYLESKVTWWLLLIPIAGWVLIFIQYNDYDLEDVPIEYIKKVQL